MQIINDNLPEHFALSGKEIKTRKTHDDKEFFILLQEKIKKDMARLFGEGKIEDKAKAFADLLICLEPIKDRFNEKMDEPFDDFLIRRRDLIGGYNQRLVMEDVTSTKEPVKLPDIKEQMKVVREFGEKNNYPKMILKKDEDNKPYKILDNGKEAWEAAFGWSDLAWPLNENFQDLYIAVKTGAIHNNDRQT